MATYQLIAATGCPTGIAHTYMAQEALEQAAKRKGITIKVETHGQIGIENELTPAEIQGAEAVKQNVLLGNELLMSLSVWGLKKQIA